MDPQFALVSREDIWRLHEDMKTVQSVQGEHSDRLARLERRQEDDARLKSVWGASSPFPSVLSGTPQQGTFAAAPPLLRRVLRCVLTARRARAEPAGCRLQGL